MLVFGQKLAKTCGEKGAWIYLSGELGAGKTTLVRGFLQGLGYEGRVKSPTYTLVEPYEIYCEHTPDQKSFRGQVYHFDFYRISKAAELMHLGLEEYFTYTAICLVEWPDNFTHQLPAPDILIRITSLDLGRQLQIESKTSRGATIVEQFLHDQI